MIVVQVVLAVVLAVLLMAVAVGWAMRGALEVRERLVPVPRSQARRRHVVRPPFLRKLSERKSVLVSAIFLSFVLFFLSRSLGRELALMGAVVLSFAYAMFCAMATGFFVWVQFQRSRQNGLAIDGPMSFRWAAWVGVAFGVLAIVYLVVDVWTTLAL